MGKEHAGTCHLGRAFFAFPGDFRHKESRRAAASPPPAKARLGKG